MKNYKKFGPFRYFTIKETGAISVWLKGEENVCRGFEWGYNMDISPLINIHIGKLKILYFHKFSGGFELHILGFWVIV